MAANRAEANPNRRKPNKKLWIGVVLASLIGTVALFYIVTTPDTPAEAANQYIEDHTTQLPREW